VCAKMATTARNLLEAGRAIDVGGALSLA
jgi:hypothetical protein